MKEYKAWIQESVSPFTNLKFASMDYPQLGDRELIIETKAATLNFADLLLSSGCLLYTSPSPRDGLLSRMPSSA